jgi:HD-like signal output (HDOD) protein
MKEKRCSCGRTFKSPEDLLKFGSRLRRCSAGFLWFNCDCMSTLVLKPAESQWFDPAQSMSTPARKLLAVLRSSQQAPLVSHSIMNIQAALEQSDKSVEQLVLLLKKEPVFASQVLEVANQQSLVQVQKINDLHHAIIYIGRDKLKETLFVAASQSFPFRTQKFNVRAFSDAAFRAGLIAELINHELKLGYAADRVYLCACLANTGKLLQALTFPAETDAVHDAVYGQPTRNRWSEVERDHFPARHTVFGEIAGMIWGASPDALTVMGLHHDHNRLFIDQSLNLTLICAAAVQLAHVLQGFPFQADEFLIQRFLKLVGKDQGWVEHMLGRAAQYFTKASA